MDAQVKESLQFEVSVLGEGLGNVLYLTVFLWRLFTDERRMSILSQTHLNIPG